MKIISKFAAVSLALAGFAHADKIEKKKEWRRNLKGKNSNSESENYNPWNESRNQWGQNTAPPPYKNGASPWSGGETDAWSIRTPDVGGSRKGGKGKSSSSKGPSKDASGAGGDWEGKQYLQLGNFGFTDSNQRATCLSYVSGSAATLRACGSSFANQWFSIVPSYNSPIKDAFMIKHKATGMFLVAPTSCTSGNPVTFGFQNQPGTEFVNEGAGASLISAYCWVSGADNERTLVVAYDTTNNILELALPNGDNLATWVEVKQYFIAQ